MQGTVLMLVNPADCYFEVPHEPSLPVRKSFVKLERWSFPCRNSDLDVQNTISKSLIHYTVVIRVNLKGFIMEIFFSLHSQSTCRLSGFLHYKVSTLLYEGWPESSATLFLLLLIYYIIVWTYSYDNQMDASGTSFFLHNLHKFQQSYSSEKQEHLSRSCISFNLVLSTTSSVTSPSLPNLFPRMASLRAPKRWKSERAGFELYGGWEGTCIYCFHRSR